MAVRLQQSKGANPWRLRIYDALYEADLEGRTLTLAELVQQSERRFNRSGTYQWWRERHGYTEDEIPPHPYSEIVRTKIELTMRVMRTHSEIANLGTNRKPLYTIGVNAPRYWHPKTYRPGRFKEYIPAQANPEAGKPARRMQSGWFADVDAELARPRPRSERMKELLREGRDLFTVENA